MKEASNQANEKGGDWHTGGKSLASQIGQALQNVSKAVAMPLPTPATVEPVVDQGFLLFMQRQDESKREDREHRDREFER